MTLDEEKSFAAAFHVRSVERCCGTCKHFVRSYEDAGCANQKQAEFDSYEQLMRKEDPYHEPETYGAYGGIPVDEGHVCDLWDRADDQTIRDREI